MPTIKKFLLLIAIVLIPYLAISQVTNSSRLTINDTSISISKSQAIRVVLDLEYLRLLLKQDSLLKIDTARYSFIAKSKDNIITYLTSENTNLSQVVINQNTQEAILNDEISKSKKKTFWTKLERDVAVIALIFVSGYAVFK